MENGKELIRINKYLAECGVCSRREADLLVDEGKVVINGKTAIRGQKIDGSEKILVNNKEIGQKDAKVVLAYYKPVGVTCTQKDKYADKKISDVFHYDVRVTYAGRLDKESEGLLIMTNDGDLIDAMMRGKNGHEKEYLIKLNKEITGDFIKKMEAGVYLEELDITTKPCKVKQLGKYTCSVILTQGVNRQLRRMAKALGYHIRSLKRTRVINIELASLQVGQYREISGNEKKTLYKMCGLEYK